MPSLLATGRVEAVGQFTVGEPLLAATVAPKKLVRIAYKDAGLDYYGNDIIATEKTITDNPAMVKAFVRATQKGMQDAFANPKEAGIILNKYQKQISPEVGEGETKLVGELAVVPGHKMGVIDQGRIQRTIDIMAKSYPMKSPVQPTGHVRPRLCGMILRICPPGTVHLQRKVTNAGAPAVELLGVTKVFGNGPETVHALGPLDLTIETGSFVSVVGPSGCGKSTLLRLIAGLDALTEGTMGATGPISTAPRATLASCFRTMSCFRGPPSLTTCCCRPTCCPCRRPRLASARCGCST